MKPGAYRFPATYQEPTFTVGPKGDKKITGWADVQATWCNVRTPNGREAMIASQAKTLATHVIEHWFWGATPKATGRYLIGDGREFYPTFVDDPDGNQTRVVAMCTETRV